MCAVTLSHAITEKKYINGSDECLLICVQILEALRYLHDDTSVLHNDLKCNNILLTNPIAKSNKTINIVIIDFGKATCVGNHNKLRLTGIEQAQYTRKYPHIAPEVIDGTQPYSCKSDMFSAGGIIYKLENEKLFSSLMSDQQHAILELAEMCHCFQYYKRPCAQKAFHYLQGV